MKLAYLVAPLLALAACSPPAVQQNEPSRIEMSAAARTEMDRINDARLLTLPQRPEAQPVAQAVEAAPDPAAT